MGRVIIFILMLLVTIPSISQADRNHFFSNSDVNISELFGESFNEGPEVRSVNWLNSNVEVRNSVSQNKRDLDVPTDKLKNKIDEEVENVRLRRQALNQIGMEMGSSDRAIYYPFGGADTQSAFLLQPTVTDVFLQTGDEFGSPNDIAKLSQLDPFEKIGGYWSGFDSYRDLFLMQEENGLKGTGFSSVARLQRHLKAEVLGIYPLEITSNGTLSLQNVGKDTPVKSALIVFRDPVSGKMKRLWQFQHSLEDAASNFPKLVARLKFGTMMIKAAPSMMFEESDLRKGALAISNDAAIRNRATVISDVRISNTGGGLNGNYPQPLFKKDSPLKTIKINKQFGSSYGYSSGASNTVFLASSDALIDSSTPLTMVSSAMVNIEPAKRAVEVLDKTGQSTKGALQATAEVCRKLFEKLKFKR